MTVYATIRRGALILLITALPMASRALSPEETVAAAERAEKGGALQQAVDLYDQFLKENPDHIQRSAVLYRMGIDLDGLGLSDRATVAFEQALAIPAEKTTGKHRPDCFMRLAKRQAADSKHVEAAATLEKFLKEGGTGLYEDEAQNLRASYLTINGRYDEAAMLFIIQRNKPGSAYAKEAAYKLPVVWLKAEKYDLAKNSIEEFAMQFPEHPRVPELFIRLARAYFGQKNYKSAGDLCQQVLRDFKTAPEALDAAFIIALCFRDSEKYDAAVERLEALSKMPQAAHDTVVTCEALFEAAQICRKTLNKPDRAFALYEQAAARARDGLTQRQQEILEQSLFFSAEYLMKQEKWSSAYDLYAQLRKIGSKINLISRIMKCESKMNKDGSMVFDSEEEIAFIRQRIAENPRTLMALQFEINLIDQKLFKIQKEIQTAAKSEGKGFATIEWKVLKPLLDEYSSLLTRYPADVLAQQDLGAYIRIRMGSLYAYMQETEPDRVGKMKIGIQLLEEALIAAPASPFCVEALEALALLAGRAGDDRKSFDTYKKLFLLTSQDPKSQRRKPADYMSGLKATATSKDMEAEVIDLMQQIIDKNPPQSEECREARFNLAEMFFLKGRLSEAAKTYKDFVRIYGPTQTVDGVVVAGWEKKVKEGPVLDQVYEAGLREAQCWRSQGHTVNMLKAYRWVMANQNFKNPRVAEATYLSLITGVKIADLPPAKKEELGRDLWTQVVNTSLDFGAKAFESGFYPWVRNPNAVPFVRVAVLKAAQLSADAGNHRRAAEMYQQYLKLYPAADVPSQVGINGKFARDEFFFMAAFAVGREYVLANDAVAMVDAFRGYLDGLRDSKFRAAALQMVGHYGTQAELYNDAADAYAALLDEYIQPSAASVKLGTVVPPEARLRKKSSWNGIRMTAPEGWDVSQIRFGLGYLYKQKEQWELCATTLLPFLTDASLRESSNRADALFTLGRCRMNLGQVKDGQVALDRLIKDHADYKGCEDAYVELVRSFVKLSDWDPVARYYTMYVAKHPDSLRRSFMDLCNALAQIGQGQVEAGERTLRELTQADTYPDVKAEAYYRLGMRKLGAKPPDLSGGFALLRKSIELFPDAPALLEAGRCAIEKKEWAAARGYLDQLLREFPRADRECVEQAQQLRRKVMEAEAGSAR